MTEILQTPNIPGERQVASIETVTQLSAEELQLAQRAYSILQTPNNLLSQGLKGQQELYYFKGDYDFYDEVGFDTFTTSFKNLRRLAGETDFQGIDPVKLDTTARTPIVKDLQYASEGRQVITGWGHDHDLKNHLVGALLSTGDVKTFIQASASAGLDKSEDKQILLGGEIDRATQQINFMWRNPQNADISVEVLTEALDNMWKVAGIQDLGQEDMRRIAEAQSEFIKDLVNQSSLSASEPVSPIPFAQAA